MKPYTLALVGILMVFGFTAPAVAALWDRGGGLIYDDVLDITWAQDANLAMTSGYDDDGLMTIAEAAMWAVSLVYQGYDDWRLPDAFNMDGSAPVNGWDQDATEMGYMFYVTLGNEATYDVYDLGGLTETGPFINLAPFRYWSDDPYFASDYYWWYFNFGSGLQWDAMVITTGYAWAVRDGDSTPVPLPCALLLLLSAMAPWVATSHLKIIFRGYARNSKVNGAWNTPCRFRSENRQGVALCTALIRMQADS